MMNDDMALVREYVTCKSEQAFETLVSRHIGLVHSAALRQVGNPHLAEEITQTVFIILARKAGVLNQKTILAGWLYRTTRYVSAAALKIQRRRERREQEAHMQAIIEQTETDSTWEQLSPSLDDAMAQLRETDRDAIVLRYFQNKSLRDVGAVLDVNESVAQKRVGRAVEKLRTILAKRGIVSTTAIITGAISANSTQAQSVALTKSVTAAAMAKGASASASTLTLMKGALKLMAWTKTKTAVVAVIAVACVVTTTTLVVYHSHSARTQMWTKNQLADAGYTTPMAALKTLLWAISNGDADMVLASLTPAEKTIAQKAWQGNMDKIMAAFKSRMAGAVDFQVNVEGGASDNITIDLISSGASGQKHERKFWFKKIGREWKCDQVHPSFDLTN